MIIVKYKHRATGCIAEPYGLFSVDGSYIKTYWVVPGLPDNFQKEQVEDSNLFEMIESCEFTTLTPFLIKDIDLINLYTLTKNFSLFLLAIVFCFGCGDMETKNDKSMDALINKMDNNQRYLDTILLNAKFNNLQTESLLGMITWRFKNRDSLMYYLGMADAYSKARKTILK